MMDDKTIQPETLRAVEQDGQWWARDWVSGPYGNTVTERYWLAFKSYRDAERFVAAAKRAVPAK